MKNLSTNTAEFSSIKAGDGNGLHLQDDGGNGIFIKDGGNLGIGTTNPVNLLHIKGPNDTSFDNINNIYSEGTDAYDSQNAGGGIQFGGKYTAGGSSTVFAQISGIKENTTDGDYKGALTFGARDGSSTNMEAMRINSSGNVGIGTTNPGATLHTYLAGGNGYNIFEGSLGGWVFGQIGTSYCQVGGLYGTHSGIAVNTSGNVGIGNTNPGEILVIQNSSNPTLQIRDGDAGSASPRTAGTLHLGESATLGVAIENYTHNFNDVCSMIFKTTPAQGSITERMRISTDGNVGINIANPQVIFEVNGGVDNSVVFRGRCDSDLSHTGTGAGNNGRFNLVAFSSDEGNDYGGGIKIQTRDGFNVFHDRMTIDSSGDVGIGTTNPIQKLHVRSDSAVCATFEDSVLIGEGSTANAVGAVTLNSDGYIWSSRNNGTAGYFNRQNSDGNVVEFLKNHTLAGVISISGTTTSYGTSSDYRLKTEVQPMAGATERLKALKPVNFAWIADGTRVDGFIAHEVQEIVPEAISGEKDAEDENGNIVPQAIDQSKLVPLLTAAIQEQQQIIESLQSQNESLAARITALEG